jgi:hypothetical protein
MTKFIKNLLCFLLVIYTHSSFAFESTADSLKGHWNGVWYIGMSSGKAVLKFNENGICRINFTNLEEFGEDEIEVNKFILDSDKISFSVPSKYSALFQIQLKLMPDGKTLDGSGKFDGAGAKLVFNKSN